MPTVTAITIRQPWASLIIEGHKPIENRSRPTRHRGCLAIHAGRTLDEEAQARFGHLLSEPDHPPRGYIIGFVRLVGCLPYRDVPASLRTWARGPWCWVLSDPMPLETPIACRGAQAFFRVSLAEGMVPHWPLTV